MAMPSLILFTLIAVLCCTIVLVEAKTCGRWKTFGGYYYKYMTGPLTFWEAEKHCRDLGGHLASIHSEKENNFIYDLISRNRITSDWHDELAYIGLWRESHRQPNEAYCGYAAVWKWTDGTDVDYVNWKHSMPDNYLNNEYCVQIFLHPAHHPAKWNDVNCEQSLLHFICKRSPQGNYHEALDKCT